ncbi:hypothetical protein ACJJTC_006536, partial [Scirpophaga incertulas]
SNRVTMKIDVSYTDHSHIIGKGGLTIKRVMEETGCHIHFPDSNRTSAVEKSNQVSIAGDMEHVERARARVRALTPLVFSFELPIVAASQPLPDLNSPYVQQIQEQYNVQVMMRNRPKLHANLLVVKGVQWEVKATMEATTLLMNYMCGALASQTQVQMTLEISPMHHGVVVGRGSEQLRAVMRGTRAQVLVPDADDPNIPALRKSCVTISGRIGDVYAARQQLVGSLPLVVIFDVSEELVRSDGEVARLMNKHNVYISVRRKPKQGIASVVIKGVERCAGDIYEARALAAGRQGAARDGRGARVVQHPGHGGRAAQLRRLRALLAAAHPAARLALLALRPRPGIWRREQPRVPRRRVSGGGPAAGAGAVAGAGRPALPRPAAAAQVAAVHRDIGAGQHHLGAAAVGAARRGLREEDLGEPDQTVAALRLPQTENGSQQGDARGGGRCVPRAPPRWAGHYFSRTSPAPLDGPPADATPEKGWRGGVVSRPNVQAAGSPPAPAPTPANTPSPAPASPASPAARVCRYTQLYDLLRNIGLHKYIELFREHELDLGTFASLSEADLAQIGVAAFGARRKMLLLIA